MNDDDHGEEFETKVTPEFGNVSKVNTFTDHVSKPEFESEQSGQLLE